MTIQEAIKSGKPFRRKGWLRFYDNLCDLNCYIYAMANGSTERRLSYVDFLADDWEIKQEPREPRVWYGLICGPGPNNHHFFDKEQQAINFAECMRIMPNIIKVREVIE